MDSDIGIDLVARNRDGQLGAVQSKCYDPTNSIGKRDIDFFLSTSARTIPSEAPGGFAGTLLSGTTDRISRRSDTHCRMQGR